MSETEGPVRVGRFEWERLMIMTVPHPQNFKLLPIGLFMSADGGRARPGNTGLAMFGPHEKTWAKLLRWAVDEGWLVLVERGGARRGPGGTTVVRASVYAASVPLLVWKRREDVLGSPPFRSRSVEGSDADPLKGAPEDSPQVPDSLKGAPETPFNAPDPSLKGASRDSLPDPLKGAIPDFEGSVSGFEGSVSGFEGSAQTLPHHVVLSSRSNSSSTSSTTVVAEASSDVLEGVVIEGGGGGDSDSRDITKRADRFVDRLDYRGKQPTRSQKDSLRLLVCNALRAGWTEQTLTDYLDLGGDAVKSPAAVYKHRLKESELPEPPTPIAAGRPLPPPCAECFDTYREAAQTNLRLRMRDGQLCPDCHPGSDSYQARQHDMDTFAAADGGMWGRAMDRAQGRMAADNWQGAGTDERVAGWMSISNQFRQEEREHLPSSYFKPSTTDQRVHQALEVGRRLQAEHDAKSAPGGHKPYSNSGWDEMEQQVANGTRPDRADRVPHCGDPECDEYSRTRQTEDADGNRSPGACGKCHPRLRF